MVFCSYARHGHIGWSGGSYNLRLCDHRFSSDRVLVFAAFKKDQNVKMFSRWLKFDNRMYCIQRTNYLSLLRFTTPRRAEHSGKAIGP